MEIKFLMSVREPNTEKPSMVILKADDLMEFSSLTVIPETGDEPVVDQFNPDCKDLKEEVKTVFEAGFEELNFNQDEILVRLNIVIPETGNNVMREFTNGLYRGEKSNRGNSEKIALKLWFEKNIKHLKIR